MQKRLVAYVSNNIALKLFFPVLHMCLRVGRMLAGGMAMPETSVHEDDRPILWKHDVRTTGQILPVETEAKTESVGDAANYQLGLRIPAPYPRHNLASFFVVDRVGHHQISSG